MSPAETPWPVVFVAAMIAVILFIAWTRNRRAGLLAGIAGCVLTGAAAMAIDQAVVTPQEQVSQSIRDIIVAFEQKQSDKVVSFISDQSPDLQRTAAGACQRLTISQVRLTDMSIRLMARNARAETRFRVNAQIQDKPSGLSSREPTMWECNWQQEPGGWKIYEVKNLDPITEKPTGLVGLPDFQRGRGP